MYEHFSPVYLPNYIYNFPIIRHSYIVVDFFFVLSGFIITLKYGKNLKTFKDILIFHKKRFFRLYPLLIFTSSVVLFFEILSNILFKSIKNSPDSFVELFVRFVNDIFLINSTKIFGPFAMNTPSWSISAEFICYLVFSFFPFLYFRIFNNRLYLYISISIMLLFASFYYDSFFSTYRFGFLRGLYSFFCGSIFYIIYIDAKKINGLYQIPLLIIFLTSFFLMSLEIKLVKTFLGVFLPLIFGFTILVLLRSKGIFSSILDKKLIREIGMISYSIYLNHFLIVLIFPRLIFEIFKLPNIPIFQILIFISSPFIVVFLSKYTHRFIEIKLNSYLRNKFNAL